MRTTLLIEELCMIGNKNTSESHELIADTLPIHDRNRISRKHSLDIINRPGQTVFAIATIIYWHNSMQRKEDRPQKRVLVVAAFPFMDKACQVLCLVMRCLRVQN